MTTIKQILWLSFLAVALSLGQVSADESYNYTIEIVKCSKAPAKRVMEKNQWKSFLKKSNALVLDSLQGVTKEGKFSLVHEGHKNPLSYKDPRAGMYQVQYVDLGFKLDIGINKQKDGSLAVNSRGERSVLSPIKEHPERASVFLYESTMTMKRGQSVVAGATKGVMNVKYLKPHFPDVPVSETDYLMMVITVE